MSTPLRFRFIVDSDAYGAASWRLLGAVPGVPVTEAMPLILDCLRQVADLTGNIPLYVPPPVLPPTWKETMDGASVNVLDGVTTRTRTYERADGKIAAAPCGAGDAPSADTLLVLAGFDLEFPMASDNLPGQPPTPEA